MTGKFSEGKSALRAATKILPEGCSPCRAIARKTDSGVCRQAPGAGPCYRCVPLEKGSLRPALIPLPVHALHPRCGRANAYPTVVFGPGAAGKPLAQGQAQSWSP